MMLLRLVCQQVIPVDSRLGVFTPEARHFRGLRALFVDGPAHTAAVSDRERGRQGISGGGSKSMGEKGTT